MGEQGAAARRPRPPRPARERHAAGAARRELDQRWRVQPRLQATTCLHSGGRACPRADPGSEPPRRARTCAATRSRSAASASALGGGTSGSSSTLLSSVVTWGRWRGRDCGSWRVEHGGSPGSPRPAARLPPARLPPRPPRPPRTHLEHLARALAVAGGDDGGVHVQEAAVLQGEGRQGGWEGGTGMRACEEVRRWAWGERAQASYGADRGSNRLPPHKKHAAASDGCTNTVPPRATVLCVRGKGQRQPKHSP